MKIFYKEEIEKILNDSAIVEAVERGFVLYSKNESIIPPVAALHFEDPPGDCHIKYGYTKKSPYYVIKIASGFYHNPQQGKPSGNGLMLLFDKTNGALVSILLDEGYLTDVRTAAAGCIAAKYLAPKKVYRIGIVGTGAQAYFQLKFLSLATSCRDVMIWGRDPSKVKQFKKNEALKDFRIECAQNLNQLTSSCNLIITTSSATKPLLFAEQIQRGTHITAIGADDIGKQELDPSIFSLADRIIVDSRSQCSEIGDVSFALQKGLVRKDQLIELGEVIVDPSKGRTSEEEITIADLTGVAIQDLQVAVAAFKSLSEKTN